MTQSKTVTGATTPGQSEPERNGKEKALHIPQYGATLSHAG